MTIPRKLLCGFYAVIAVAALIATWVQNAAYFPKGAGFLKDFALDLKANPATRSISALIHSGVAAWPHRCDMFRSIDSTSATDMPASRTRWPQIAGSTSPLRVPITSPSSGVIPTAGERSSMVRSTTVRPPWRVRW